MKKILALILVVCALFSFASCGLNKGDDSDAPEIDEVARFSDMLAVSVPTSSSVVVTQVVNDMTIESVFTLQTGTVSGKKAAVYENTVNTLGNVEDRVLNLLKTREETVWYLEGYGTSTNKGRRWTADGKDFSPKAGSLSMDLQSGYIQSYDYSKNGALETLVITMTADNATKALSNFLDGNQKIKQNVTVTITAAAERISSITIEYIVPEDNLGTDAAPIWVYDMEMTIAATYSYKTDTGDIPITLD